MSDEEENDVKINGIYSRIINGRINMGFQQYKIQERKNGHGGRTVEIFQNSRKHAFGKGYIDDGRSALPLTYELNTDQAKIVRDLLDYWIQNQETE